jgi:hypothetical protein
MFLIPKYSRKTISGWINLSGMVTIQKFYANNKDNRGTKSVNSVLNNTQNLTVKAQRVDGSWDCNSIVYTIKMNKKNIRSLRCTLTNYENNLKVKNLFNFIIKKNFSTSSSYNINPWFLTGLVDAEGMFTIKVDKYLKNKTGWRVQSVFQVGLHIRDLELLEKMQKYFGNIGSISKSGDLAYYSVSSIKDLTSTIIPHFDNYYLLTQKKADYLLFKQVVGLMIEKAHLSVEGLNEIINIKAAINLGLSEVLKSEFPYYVSVIRPIINTLLIPDHQWVSGFVNGEGTFDIKIYKSNSKLGQSVQLRFRVAQHDRDLKLMELFISYFNSGRIEKDSRFPAVYYIVTEFTDIEQNIIPFFNKNMLLGVKQLDFLDWCKASQIITNKEHLTKEGFNSILNIKLGMNTGRKLK